MMTENDKRPIRIISYGIKAADQFQAHPQNWRKHPQRQREVVKQSLDAVGWVNVVIENVVTGNLIDGHERIWQALETGEDVPFIQVELTEDEEKTALAMIDWTASLAEADTETLSELLQSINMDGVDELLATMADDFQLDIFEDEPAEDPGAQVDRAEELREIWQTERGQVWQIGSHRMMCGDSTNTDDVAELMQGEHYALLVTDPPYGVSYASKNEYLNAIAPANRIQTPIKQDHAAPEDMATFWKSAFRVIREFAQPGASYYVTGPQGGDLLLLLLALSECNFPLRHMLIWAKNNHVLGRSDYNYKHEPIIYGWVNGAAHSFYGDAGEVSLWEIDKPQKSELHPTMKPVQLYERAIYNSSARGEIVADFFAGSGTCGVAAEHLKRRAYMMEYTPEYVAVILQRLSDMGLWPRLID